MAQRKSTSNRSKNTVASTKKVERDPKVESKLEGLTAATKETGIITYQEGSGSAQILDLIRKHGFDKGKVITEAKKLKAAGKAFKRSDPEKKWTKMAGVIKRLQKNGFNAQLAAKAA